VSNTNWLNNLNDEARVRPTRTKSKSLRQSNEGLDSGDIFKGLHIHYSNEIVRLDSHYHVDRLVRESLCGRNREPGLSSTFPISPTLEWRE